MLLTALNCVKNLPCIGQAAYNTYLNLNAFIIYRKFSYKAVFPDTALNNAMEHFLAVTICKITKYGFCNTAGYTEYHTCTRAISKWNIRCFRIQILEINTCCRDHFNELGRCNYIVSIALTVGITVGTFLFHLFGSTWHDRNHNSAFAFRIILRLPEIFLNCRREHALR